MIILRRIIVVAFFLLSAVAFPVHAARNGISAKKGIAGADPFRGAVNRAYDLKISWFYNWAWNPFWGSDPENFKSDYWDNPNLEFVPMWLQRGRNLSGGCRTPDDKTKIANYVNNSMNTICANTTYCNKGKYYLIGNEPELSDQDLLPGSTDPAGDAAACYGTIIKTIKTKDPTAKFIILGTAWVNESFIRNFITKWKTVWQGTDMENLPQLIKGWHLHTYGNYWDCPTSDAIPRSYLNIINSQMQTTFGQTVFDQELWVTEIGSLNNLPNLSNQIERQKFLNRMKCLVDVYENSPIITRYAWFYAGGSGWASTSLYGRSSSGSYYITDLGIKYASLALGPTLTPTPTRSVTPTPTPTDTPSSCIKGDLGNLDCSVSGDIGVQDLDILIRCWGTGCITNPASRPTNAKRSPDIIKLPDPPTNNRVDIYDLDRLVRCWGTSCLP